MQTEIIITLITGFVSIITLLLKYRIDNHNLTKQLKENDKKQDNQIKTITDKLDELNYNFNRFVTKQELDNKINKKYIDMQYNLSKVIIKDIQNEEHNGDLIKANQKIEDFKEIIENE